MGRAAPIPQRYNARGINPEALHPMRRAIRVLTLVALLALVIAAPAAAAPPPQAGAVVRAVFFYSPTCGHCQYVITEVFPPLFEEYGDQLEIIGVDVTNP